MSNVFISIVIGTVIGLATAVPVALLVVGLLRSYQAVNGLRDERQRNYDDGDVIEQYDPRCQIELYDVRD